MAVESGSYTDATMESRRRLAEAMMKQGMETSPIGSHWQGLARLANAMLGGIGLNRIDRESKERDKEYADTLLRTLDSASGDAMPSTSGSASTGDKAIPASIRTNNPGAMWPGPSAAKFGSTAAENVAGGNKAAVFASPEDGAAAQFDLLNRAYAGKPLSEALKKWSGGNNVEAYVARVSKETGLTPDTVISPELLRSPQGIALAKAMALHEANVNFPLDDAGWSRAQARALGGAAGGQEGQPPPATGGTQTAVGANPGVSQAMPRVPPQVRAQIGALLASPDPRARALGQKMVAEVITRQVKPTELATSAIYGTDEKGNPVIMQMSPTGQMVRSQLPPGVTPSTGVDKLDLGTSYMLRDKKSGANLGTVPKDIVGKEAAEERGKALGQAQVDLPRVESNAARTLKYIDDVLEDKNLGNVTGWQSSLLGDANKKIPWNADTVARIDQLKGKAFLEAFNSLKGAGQITEIEGAKATDALARLTNLDQTDAGYVKALNDFKAEVKALVELAKQKAGQGGQSQAPDGPKVRTYNPQTGRIE